MKKKLLFLVFVLAANGRVFGGEVVLEDNSLLAAFDSHSGALTRLEDKTSHWVLERRPELGASFRMFAPLPDRRYNPILGQKQTAAKVDKISAGEVRIEWKDPVSENGGIVPMTFSADVTLTNGALTFNATLENNSALTVETVDYPYLGDVNPAGRDSTLTAITERAGRSRNRQSDEIYPHFRNEKGYWGVFYPQKTREAQQNPFCLIQSPDQGLYVGVEGSPLHYRVQYTFEQYPGVISAVTALVPQGDEIAGTSVHLEFRTCHFVFAGPHSTVQFAPVILRFYKGEHASGSDRQK